MSSTRRALSHTYAQTNLQIYNQLLSNGYSDRDLQLVRQCYDLATVLFSGLYRPTGKPFLAHLVSTASILVEAEARPAVVGAGLLHAAFTHGDFGIAFPSRRRRNTVRRSTSTEVEDLVVRYTALAWTDASIAALQNDAMALATERKDVILIRLANELEDALDLGLMYCRKGEARQIEISEYLEILATIARNLEHCELATSLVEAASTYRVELMLPAVIRTEKLSSYSSISPSYRMRFTVRAARALFGAARPALDHVAGLMAAKSKG